MTMETNLKRKNKEKTLKDYFDILQDTIIEEIYKDLSGILKIYNDNEIENIKKRLIYE